MHTPPSKTTSIHTVHKHKSAVKNKVNKLHDLHYNQEDQSLFFSYNIQGSGTPGKNVPISQPFSYKQIVDFGVLKRKIYKVCDRVKGCALSQTMMLLKWRGKQ
jgi:hypothetical protein